MRTALFGITLGAAVKGATFPIGGIPCPTFALPFSLLPSLFLSLSLYSLSLPDMVLECSDKSADLAAVAALYPTTVLSPDL